MVEAFDKPINGLAWPDVKEPSSSIAMTSLGRVKSLKVLLMASAF